MVLQLAKIELIYCKIWSDVGGSIVLPPLISYLIKFIIIIHYYYYHTQLNLIDRA